MALFGVASLFGFARVSELMGAIERDVRGRIVVFFPGRVRRQQLSAAGRAGWVELSRGSDHPERRPRGAQRKPLSPRERGLG